jgi:hypothetical protein
LTLENEEIAAQMNEWIASNKLGVLQKIISQKSKQRKEKTGGDRGGGG